MAESQSSLTILYWNHIKSRISATSSSIILVHFTPLFLSLSRSWFPYLCVIEARQNVGPFPCAVQSVGEGCRLKSLPLGTLTRLFSTARQGDSLHTFSFMGPFLIHHNTASILLTSPAKHTSLPVPSLFFCFNPYSTSPHPIPHDTHKHTYTSTYCYSFTCIQIKHRRRG